MKNRWLYVLLLIPVFYLTNCSWVEYFSVVNNTDQDAAVTYELDTTLKGFPIFYSKPSCYEITRGGNINWDVKAEITDSNPARHLVTVTIPPQCVLVFGGLTNDKYVSYNQTFINDRKFNLKKLSVECGDFIRQVTPSVFDSHFQKVKGNIKMVVK